MKKKFLSISSILVILLLAVGCGSGATNNSDSTKHQTNLSVEFKSANGIEKSYQKVGRDEVATVSITIAKNGTAYLDNAPMVKDAVTKKWGIGVNLDNALAPYDVLVIAKDSSDNVLFKSKAGSTIASLNTNVVLVVEEVVATNPTSTNLPSIKSITHNKSGNNINIHFVINNATRYELSSTTGGTFATDTGTLATTTEAQFDAVYTKSATETDVLLKIKLFNANGDSKSIPFNINEVSNTLTINFPPSVNIEVEEKLVSTNTYKITATVTDDDSSSWSYDWNRIRGAKALASDGTNPNILEIEGLTGGELYPMCFALTVTDDEGASARVDYCIKNADNGYVGLKKTGQTKSYNLDGDEVTNGSVKDDGFYQKGLTSHYTRDDVAQTVTDHVTGLVWQDDEDVKPLTNNWNEAKAYCKNKGSGWYLPTLQELNSIVEYDNANYINSIFKNVSFNRFWSSLTVVQASTTAWGMSASGENMNLGDKIKNKNCVRCVKGK